MGFRQINIGSGGGGGAPAYDSQQSLSFNGTDERVTVPDAAPLAFTTTMSAFCWVKATAPGALVVVFNQYDTSGGGRAWYMGNFSNASHYAKLGVVVSAAASFNAATAKSYYSTNPCFDGTWHHIGFTFSSGTLKLYIDGVEETVTKDADGTCNSLYNSTGVLAIGALTAGAAYFAGKVDEPCLFNVALTAPEVLELYNGGVPLDVTLHSQAAACVAWWKFEDASMTGSGGVLDSIGTNHGTFVNMDNTNISTDAP